MTSCFSPDYRTARKLILRKTAAAGDWTHEAFKHPVSGRDGEPVYTDVFWKGPKDATRVLTISSGIHGVEGFCGSAAQCQFIEDAPPLAEDTAILLIHAVNPYGFSHLRRVNENNVDLNRNFIDFDAGLPQNEKYRELYDLLNPDELPPEGADTIIARVEELRASMEALDFMKAVTGGQYEFPDGIQFGGREPAWSRRTMEKIWDSYLSHAAIVVQIDVHTGLGPSGLGLLMMAADDEEPHKALTAEWFGDMFVTPRPHSASDTILGGYMNAGMEDHLGARTWVIPMTLEYGTEPAKAVLGMLIEDNWLTHHGDVESERGRDIRQRLLRVFYPDDKAWKDAVLTRARDVFDRALAGLQSLSPEKRYPQ